MKKRIITGIIMLIIFVPIFLIEELNSVFEITMLVLSIVGVYEMQKMFDEEHKVNKSYQFITMFLSIFFFYSVVGLFRIETYLIENISSSFYQIGILSTVFILLLLLVFIPDFNGKKISESLVSIIYPSMGFAAIFLLKYKGTEYLIYLFLISMLTDMFAYFVGIKFGKHKLCPAISPKKSIEGSIGGTSAAVIISFFFAYFYKGGIFVFGDSVFGNIMLIILLSLLASIVSQIGDLVASKFKRTEDIKDFSNIFPGHGGVLDRFDSAIFLAIFLWMIMVIFQI